MTSVTMTGPQMPDEAGSLSARACLRLVLRCELASDPTGGLGASRLLGSASSVSDSAGRVGIEDGYG